MDPNIVSGIIGASATILVGIITLPGIKSFLIQREKSNYYIKKPRRLNVIKGKWKGFTKQENSISGVNVQVDLDADLDVVGNLICGETYVSWQENKLDQHITVKCEGGFVSENYIRILYHYPNGDVQNYGVMFLFLDGSGRQLKGNMIGYGHRSESIVKGETNFTKIS